jgi:hypothetical protein
VYPPCHDLVAFSHQLKPTAVFFWTNSWKKAIGWDPTRPTTENINVVDTKEKRLSVLICFLYEFTFSEACLLCPSIADGALMRCLNSELVYRLFSVSVGEPE